MILHSFSQETDLLMKVIMKCVNIKLWDILGCFHYILNAPRTLKSYFWRKNVIILSLCTQRCYGRHKPKIDKPLVVYTHYHNSYLIWRTVSCRVNEVIPSDHPRRYASRVIQWYGLIHET